MKHKSVLTFVLLFVMLLSVLFGGCAPKKGKETVPNPTEVGGESPGGVIFSREAGFYDRSFDLELSVHESFGKADIYYTIDGSIPSRSSTKYTRPIRVESRTDVGGRTQVDVLSVRAIAVKDGETSDIVTQSYVKGFNVGNRFDYDMLVFALSSDPHGLYDHNDGIFVEGVDREQWRAQNPGRSPNQLDSANFNRRGRESERAVHVEMFDRAGVLHISQRAGMRVKGGYSRSDHRQQFSLELYAREEYGDRNNFLFPFFGENSSDGNIINRYRRVRLRNGANDRDFGTVRDELTQTLFCQAGQPDYQMHTPAAVFLNGEYYGFAWLKTPRTENHWARKYGGDSADFRHIGDNEKGLNGEADAVADWAGVYALAEEGLLDDTRFEEFCRRVDIDDFMRYYAIQVYTHNRDWPGNNIEMWRYFPPQEQDASSNKYLDGKWRFIPQDVEFNWNLYGTGNESENTLSNVLDGFNHMGGNSVLLAAVLSRTDMKVKFANTLVDLMDGAFRADNVIAVLDSLLEKNTAEVRVALGANKYAPGNEWWPSLDSMRESQDMIRSFARRRPDLMYGFIKTTLGLDKADRYAVNLTVSQGGGAMMNTRPVAESQTAVGNYYNGSNIKITAEPYPGYVVSHWTVDGERREGNVITVSGAAIVQLHFSKSADANLYISEVKTGQNGYIKIQNDTDRELSTDGMYLSDSNSNFLKWKLPSIDIKSGEHIFVATKNSDFENAAAKADFNIKLGDRLRLTADSGNNVLSFVEVSFMRENRVQRRARDGKFSIVNPTSNV